MAGHALAFPRVKPLPDKPLHMLVASTDQVVRQIVDILDQRADLQVVGSSEAAVSELRPDTGLVVLDEATVGPAYLSVIKRLRRETPEVEVAVVGGPKSDELLRGDAEQGVDTYLQRPLDVRDVAATLDHKLQMVTLQRAAGIVGRSPAIREVLEAVRQLGPTEVSILIEGESGTGKDLVARAVHLSSRRSTRPFEAINCGALAEGVLESELFGHERGAFTGAVSRRPGLFERANGGTVFLDEVGEMSANMQVKLLRVLETGDVLRVGGVERLHVDVRVVAATNRSLADAVRAGTFRQDLYYRLKGVHLQLPPLRDRRDDIPLLANHFLLEANRRHQKSVRAIEANAMRRLQSYTWPGNVREMRNVVDSLVVLAAGSRISYDQVDRQLDSAERDASQPMLPVPLGRSKDEAEREMIYASILALHRDVREILERLGSARAPEFRDLREVTIPPTPDRELSAMTLEQMEREAIREALRTHQGNRRQAAQSLGISERTLYRKIKEYGLV